MDGEVIAEAQITLKKLLILCLPDSFYAPMQDSKAREKLYTALINNDIVTLNKMFRVKEAHDIQEVFEFMLEGFKPKHVRKEEMLEHIYTSFNTESFSVHKVSELYLDKLQPIQAGNKVSEFVQETIKRLGESIRSLVDENMGKPKNEMLRQFIDTVKGREYVFTDAVSPFYSIQKVLGLWVCYQYGEEKMYLTNASLSLTLENLDNLINGNLKLHFNFINLNTKSDGTLNIRTMHMYDSCPIEISLGDMKKDIKGNVKIHVPKNILNPTVVNQPIDATNEILSLIINHIGREHDWAYIDDYEFPTSIQINVDVTPIKEGCYPELEENGMIILVASLNKPTTFDELSAQIPKYNFIPPRGDIDSSTQGIPKDEENNQEEAAVFFSFICPLTHERMKLPVRGKDCTHIPCFDFSSYMELTKLSPMNCPLCQKPCSFSSLRVDCLALTAINNVKRNNVYLQYSKNIFTEVQDDPKENPSAETIVIPRSVPDNIAITTDPERVPNVPDFTDQTIEKTGDGHSSSGSTDEFWNSE